MPAFLLLVSKNNFCRALNPMYCGTSFNVPVIKSRLSAAPYPSTLTSPAPFFGMAKGKFHHGMLKGQTWVNNSLERRTSYKKKNNIKYLPVLSGESCTTSLVELPSPDIRSVSVQSPSPATSLAVLPQSVLSLTPASNAGGISAVTWCQWPTAKVKVEAGMGMVT